MANSDQAEHVPPEQPARASLEKPPASPHDTLVYKILSDPVLAAAELKAVLPKEVADEITWENLELDNHRFVTGNLDNQFTDVLFKTTIRDHDIRIRLLLEHSSHAKPFELLQTLQYQVLGVFFVYITALGSNAVIPKRFPMTAESSKRSSKPRQAQRCYSERRNRAPLGGEFMSQG